MDEGEYGSATDMLTLRLQTSSGSALWLDPATVRALEARAGNTLVYVADVASAFDVEPGLQVVRRRLCEALNANRSVPHMLTPS